MRQISDLRQEQVLSYHTGSGGEQDGAWAGLWWDEYVCHMGTMKKGSGTFRDLHVTASGRVTLDAKLLYVTDDIPRADPQLVGQIWVDGNNNLKVSVG